MMLIYMYSYIENIMHPKEASSIDIEHSSSIVRIHHPKRRDESNTQFVT